MIEKNQLDKCLFLDVETATGYPDYETMEKENPRLAKMWDRRCKYYKGAYPEFSTATNAEIYKEKASLEPEFARIVCVSFGVWHNESARLSSYYGADERDILEKTAKVLQNSAERGLKITGHNVKGFDVPCIAKRIIYTEKSSHTLPSNLMVFGKKPWEINYLDTSEIFAFGSWSQQKYLSLDLLSCSLGIDSPKEDMDGSMVSEAYWVRGEHEKIKEYCERDVKAVIDILHLTSR